jgi:glycerophosphoryl diester phosphodiesterase
VAFAAGLAAGADRLELDVHGTADGHVVVLHDAALDRTTDGSGPVRGRTLAEVRALDAGCRFTAPDGSHPWRGQGVRVPTLDELLAAHPDVPLNIEVKQEEPPIESAVLATLDRHAARARTLLAAEHASIMARIRAAAPDVLTSCSAAEAAEFVLRVRDGEVAGWTTPAVALQVPPRYGGIDVVTPESVAAAHAHGLEVHVWTINDAAEMDALLEIGVDAIMTDVPAVAVDVLRRRGLR